MNNNSSLNRKIIYLVLMAIALVPLYLLSAPSFLSEEGKSPGGVLTQLRAPESEGGYGLAQSSLGEIDPASESMKLATLGMRGIAANLLWERANEYKKKEEWDNLRATLNQIAKLQPNFISVWQFQAWNLSYNVSVEFDNYEHRYHWVKKGIDFMMQGIRYNANEPSLLSDLGWFFGHKLGRSDEYVQFRRKYRTDEDFHKTLETHIDVDEALDYDDKPDNWLTAHEWHKLAQEVVDQKGVPVRRKNPLVFHSDSAKDLIRYADAIEIEGKFGDYAYNAWVDADQAWKTYGGRDIPTSKGFKINLNSYEKWFADIGRLGKEMEDLAPGLRERIERERREALTDEEEELLAKDRADLDAGEYEKVLEIDESLNITAEDIIAEINDPDKKRRARVLAKDIDRASGYSTIIRRYRDVVNYIYWKTRCEVEQKPRAIEARKYLWDANEKYENADLLGALKDYDQSWERWAEIHDQYEVLAEDVTAEDLVDHIKRYRTLLNQLDRDFPPPNFPMLKLVANYPDELGYTRDEAEAMLKEANRKAGKKDDTEKAPEETGTPDTSEASKEESSEDAEATDKSEASTESANNNLISLSPQPETADDGESAAGQEASALLEAERLYQDADLAAAKSKFEEGFSEVDIASMTDDGKASLVQQLQQYRTLLGQLDEAFPPKGFALSDFVKEYAEDFGYTTEEVNDLFSGE